MIDGKLEYLELWEILVPTRSTYGTKFTLDHHLYWESKVCEVTGGLTLMPTVTGRWANTQETSIPMRLAATFEVFAAIMKKTQQHYNQAAVLGYRVSDMALIWRRA